MNLTSHKASFGGFSLIELMTTIAIASVLLGVAAPSMRDAALNSSISASHNELVSSLQLARSEAITQSRNVSVCARSTNAQCGTDWNNGWLVFTDHGATRGTIDADETVLSIVGPLAAGLTIANRARTSNSGTTSARNFVRFSARGGSHWRGGGSFWICDNSNRAEPRALNVIMSGDVRKAIKNSEGSLINAFGIAISCTTADPV